MAQAGFQVIIFNNYLKNKTASTVLFCNNLEVFKFKFIFFFLPIMPERYKLNMLELERPQWNDSTKYKKRGQDMGVYIKHVIALFSPSQQVF